MLQIVFEMNLPLVTKYSLYIWQMSECTVINFILIVMCFLFLPWFQQRYMIAAIQELSKEPNQESAKPAASFLEACNLLFERGLLSNRRINSLCSPAIENIKKGMAFFEKWCHSHEETGNFTRHSVVHLLNLHTISYMSWFNYIFLRFGVW